MLLAHAAAARATEDGLRQLGVRSLHTLTLALTLALALALALTLTLGVRSLHTP